MGYGHSDTRMEVRKWNLLFKKRFHRHGRESYNYNSKLYNIMSYFYQIKRHHIPEHNYLRGKEIQEGRMEGKEKEK
jgi:hypothetical protein